MNYYFSLQYKRLSRHFQAVSIPPFIGFASMLLLFFALSELLFHKVQFAAYLYPFLAISAVNLFGEIQRNEFLKTCYSIADYRKIRLFENLFTALPFSLFLLSKNEYFIAFALFPIVGILSHFNQINRFRFVMPTPFFRFPYEFTAGFRRAFGLLGLCYVIAVIAAIVGNFNMGIFTLLFVFFICMGFYGKPEPEFYVWVHAETPVGFLLKKMKIAVLYSLGLSIPILVLLMLFYPSQFAVILLVELLGMLFLVTILLGKYAYFPTEINLIPGLLIALSIFLPPFLILVVPFLFFKAKRNLQSFLK